MVQVLVAMVVEAVVMARVLEETKKMMAQVQVSPSFCHSLLQVAGQVEDWCVWIEYDGGGQVCYHHLQDWSSGLGDVLVQGY